MIIDKHKNTCCAGYLAHPFGKRRLESDLLVPFCLQVRGGTGKIREHACIFHALVPSRPCFLSS